MEAYTLSTMFDLISFSIKLVRIVHVVECSGSFLSYSYVNKPLFILHGHRAILLFNYYKLLLLAFVFMYSGACPSIYILISSLSTVSKM